MKSTTVLLLQHRIYQKYDKGGRAQGVVREDGNACQKKQAELGWAGQPNAKNNFSPGRLRRKST